MAGLHDERGVGLTPALTLISLQIAAVSSCSLASPPRHIPHYTATNSALFTPLLARHSFTWTARDDKTPGLSAIFQRISEKYIGFRVET